MGHPPWRLERLEEGSASSSPRPRLLSPAAGGPAWACHGAKTGAERDEGSHFIGRLLLPRRSGGGNAVCSAPGADTGEGCCAASC